MDSQQGKLISNSSQTDGFDHSTAPKQNSKQSELKPQEEGIQKVISKSKQKAADKQEQSQQKQIQQGPVDIVRQLTVNKNPLPLLAVLDQVDLYSKTKDGEPLFNLLMNKFLPLEDLLQQTSIKFTPDEDGRTPLHYAVQVDDPKAVYWLLKKGAHNTADKFGNTPAMDAIRLGHRRSFLLCMHFQHFHEQLAHKAAQYNRIWELRCLLALGLNLQVKNGQLKTPLEVAVENYSYDAAQYLASVTYNYKIADLKALTDSKAIINKVKNGKQKTSKVNRILKPLLLTLIPLILIWFQIPKIQHYQQQYPQIRNIIILIVSVQALSCIVSKLLTRPVSNKEPILHLLHYPQFPNSTDHICPSCLARVHPDRQEHCDSCHFCVPKLQKHQMYCINRYNQILWFIGEFVYMYLLWRVVSVPVYYIKANFANKEQQQASFTQLYVSLLYNFFKNSLFQFSFSIYILGLAIQQFLLCLQLFGMAFMNRTYGQTIRTQQYPQLFRVFKNKAGKLKNKEYRIFYEYKLLGGLCVGISNIIKYFC